MQGSLFFMGSQRRPRRWLHWDAAENGGLSNSHLHGEWPREKKSIHNKVKPESPQNK